jgi:hypothetical protein
MALLNPKGLGVDGARGVSFGSEVRICAAVHDPAKRLKTRNDGGQRINREKNHKDRMSKDGSHKILTTTN